MKAMILAAGRGERLRPLTDHIPKPVISVGGELLIDRHLRHLVAAGFNEVVINVSYMADAIEARVGCGARQGIRIIYIDEGADSLGVGGGVRNALEFLGTSHFLLISADVFSDWRITKMDLPAQVSAHLLLAKRKNGASEIYFSLKDGYVEKSDSLQELVYGGIGFFHPEVFSSIAGRTFPLWEALRVMVNKKTVTGNVYSGLLVDAGTLAGLSRARRRAVFR